MPRFTDADYRNGENFQLYKKEFETLIDGKEVLSPFVFLESPNQNTVFFGMDYSDKSHCLFISPNQRVWIDDEAMNAYMNGEEGDWYCDFFVPIRKWDDYYLPKEQEGFIANRTRASRYTYGELIQTYILAAMSKFSEQHKGKITQKLNEAKELVKAHRMESKPRNKHNLKVYMEWGDYLDQYIQKCTDQLNCSYGLLISLHTDYWLDGDKLPIQYELTKISAERKTIEQINSNPVVPGLWDTRNQPICVGFVPNAYTATASVRDKYDAKRDRQSIGYSDIIHPAYYLFVNEDYEETEAVFLFGGRILWRASLRLGYKDLYELALSNIMQASGNYNLLRTHYRAILYQVVNGKDFKMGNSIVKFEDVRREVAKVCDQHFLKQIQYTCSDVGEPIFENGTWNEITAEFLNVVKTKSEMTADTLGYRPNLSLSTAADIFTNADPISTVLLSTANDTGAFQQLIKVTNDTMLHALAQVGKNFISASDRTDLSSICFTSEETESKLEKKPLYPYDEYDDKDIIGSVFWDL
jgi:hypothetical protein